jgi:hypothetical protein
MGNGETFFHVRKYTFLSLNWFQKFVGMIQQQIKINGSSADPTPQLN